MRDSYHRWTAAEEIELLRDVNTQGLEVAIKNFSAAHGIPPKAVRNRAAKLKKGDFTQRHLKEVEYATLKMTANVPQPPEEKIKATKTDKITIMVAKEYMNKLKVEFSEGKLTIMYPKEDQLDIKFL